MQVEQFVMAYAVEQDRLRALLPEGVCSLRPVLRINAEIKDGTAGYVEYNTAVEKDGIRGWINIDRWENVPFERMDRTVIFKTPFLTLFFAPVGITGGCPAEQDHGGCYYKHGAAYVLRAPETILSKKEFCDCEFAWAFTEGNAHGKSIGKTLPAIPTACKTVYPKVPFTAAHAAKIPCAQVLGSYTVVFERNKAHEV